MEYRYALKVYLKLLSLEDVPVLYRDTVNDIVTNKTEALLNWVREQKWDEIKFERDRLEQAGLPFKNSVLDYDMLSVTRLTQAENGLKRAVELGQVKEEEAVIEWTMQDNTVMNLTLDDLKNIPLVAVNYSNSLHQKAREYRVQIYESEDIAEVNSITWQS